MRFTMGMMGAGALALAACSGGSDEGAPAEPPVLELTPGSWAANDAQASYADEDGHLLATLRCDAETAELMLETAGDFAEGARPAMLVRAGQFMHGVEGVEVRRDPDGPVKVARIPVTGPLADTLLGSTGPMTIETEGADPVMVETDAQLQGFIRACRAQAEAAGGGTDIGEEQERVD